MGFLMLWSEALFFVQERAGCLSLLGTLVLYFQLII